MFALSLVSLLLAAPSSIMALHLPKHIPDNCTLTTTLPSKTVTKLFPTTVITGHEPEVHPGTTKIVYTTVLPTLGPGGLEPCTYTITQACPGTPGSPCHQPESTAYPPDFHTKTTVCHVCGPEPVTVTLAVPPPVKTGHSEPPYHPSKECQGEDCESGHKAPSKPVCHTCHATATGMVTATGHPSYHHGTPAHAGYEHPKPTHVVPGTPEHTGVAIATPSVVEVVGSASNTKLSAAWLAALPVIIAIMGA